MTPEQIHLMQLEAHVATLFTALGALSDTVDSLCRIVESRAGLADIPISATAH